nr:hypothetical protein [Tanacetum cinerariifolium]
HRIKKKPQTESEACKNMILYLKNTEGYKMDFFKGKKYDEILLIFHAKFDANMKFLFKSREEMEKEDEESIKSINETPAQKAAKRRKLSEEAQEADALRKRLENVQDEDDDLLELMLLKRSKKNTKCVSAANEEFTAAKHNLKLKLFKDVAAVVHANDTEYGYAWYGSDVRGCMRFIWQTESHSTTLADNTTYLASADDIAVQSCFFDIQLTNLSPRNCIPPEVLLQWKLIANRSKLRVGLGATVTWGVGEVEWYCSDGEECTVRVCGADGFLAGILVTGC